MIILVQNEFKMIRGKKRKWGKNMENQQDAQRKVVPQLGGSAVDVAGIELVVLAAQKEGAGGWTQHVAGDDRAVGNGDVLYQGEDRFSLFAGADV